MLFRSKEASEKKIAAIEKSQATNHVAQAKSGVAMVKAAEHALNLDPAPSPFTDAAKLTIGRANLSFSAAEITPDSSEVLRLQKMVEGLLSTNVALRAESSNILLKADSALAASESKQNALAAKLDAANAKLAAVNAENAGLADSWARILHWFWFAVWTIGIVFAVRIFGALIPPPYNSFVFLVDHIAGGFIGGILKLLPMAKVAAGVVSKDVHDLTERTLNKVVKAVEEVRAKGGEASTSLETALDYHADDATRANYVALKLKL